MLFNTFLENLPDCPSFTECWIKDENPLSAVFQKRRIYIPNESMSILHKRLIKYLRNLKVPLPFAFGARPKNSPLKNVWWHRHNRYFYLLDLHKAYSSVSCEKLARILCCLDEQLKNFEQEVYKFLDEYCFYFGKGLVAGAPASPDLFNIYAGILIDKPLGELCRKHNLTFTRYLDDLTFSSSKIPIGRRKRQEIRTIIKGAGFEVNHHKSRVCDLKKGAIVINGVGLEMNERTFVPRDYLRKIRGFMRKLSLEETLKKTDKQTLIGMMAAFWGVTDRKKLNKTEQKLVKKYQALTGSVAGR